MVAHTQILDRALQNFDSLRLFDPANQTKLVFLSVEIRPLATNICRYYFADDHSGTTRCHEPRELFGKGIGAINRCGGVDSRSPCDRCQVGLLSGLARGAAAASVQVFVVEDDDAEVFWPIR